MRLESRVALITGAGGPMGRAIAERFAREGASLVITDISGNRLAETMAALDSHLRKPARAVAERADVTRREQAEAVVERAFHSFGRVDILINVVGGIKSATLFEPVLSMSEERWNATFDLNLKGNLHLIQLLAPSMLGRRYGKIVNFASINFAGEIGSADYSAAKAAVASLTRTLAIEFAPHVNVNCIAPGTIRTSVIARLPADELAYYESKPLLKRIGEPEDIANACLFFASEESSYITGEILCVSGGVWPSL